MLPKHDMCVCVDLYLNMDSDLCMKTFISTPVQSESQSVTWTPIYDKKFLQILQKMTSHVIHMPSFKGYQ